MGALRKPALCPFLVLLTVFELLHADPEESVQYLQNAMWDLKNRLKPTSVHAKRRVDTLQLKDPEPHGELQDNVPMLSLTKAELAALYEAALHKEVTANSNSYDSPYVQAIVHDAETDTSNNHDEKSNYDESDSDDASGYYYYYYPISSFIDGTPHPDTPHSAEDEKILPHYHSHTHQHNVHITATKGHLESDNKKKMMEPLFMAVSSFIGMAVMFILSIIFLPKFGGLKSRGVKQNGEISTLLQVILKAVEGDDCSERIACELGKTAKAFKAHDNRFVKLFRRLSPATIKWYVDGITKYAQTNITCTKIHCRPKNAMQPKPLHRRN